MSTTVIILVIILAVWWFSKQRHEAESNSNKVKISEKSEKNDITEEAVFKIQADFEEKLHDNYAPDAIDGKEIYIYKHLMRPWFDKLSSKNRYDKTMIQKLRNDWVDYMTSLEDRNTSNYLFFESEKQEDENSYRDEHVIASRKVFAIENAFASAIGNEAEEELARITNLDSSSFHRHNGDIAPEGFEFGVDDELKPKK